MSQPAILLLVAVVAVGVFHTMVPDHWVPIAMMARAYRWNRRQTARAAFGAGLGHTLSTLAIGIIVWFAGLAFAVRFGHLVSIISSIALIAFGAFIAIAAYREIRTTGGNVEALAAAPAERPNSRMALLLILGSSPMVEGIPAFFAAVKFGIAQLAFMSVLFALSTIATYVALCVYSTAGLQRFSLGPLERYGEVLSGSTVAAVGIVFAFWPLA